MSGISEERKQYQREYNRRYYEQKLKQKRQQQRIGDNQGQLDLFDLKLEKFDTDTDSNIDLTQEFDSQKSSLTPPKRRISLNRLDLDSNIENQTSNILTLTSNTEVNNQTFQTMNQVIDEVAHNIHQLAFNRLFPSAKRTINWWVIGELIALSALSIIVVFYTAQAVALIDKNLLPLIVLLEAVSMFFSLTLAKWSAVSFFMRCLMLIVCVGLTNFLVAKATLAQGENLIEQGRSRVNQVSLLQAEIQRERASILDLEARGRLTVANERTKRLDVLMAKLEVLKGQSVYTIDREMVALQIIIRIILGLSVILINHQISQLIVNKKIFKLAV